MSASLEKVTNVIDLSGKLADTHDLLVKSAKIASIIGAVCGFIFLLSYTTHVGIPFPLELSVLPTTLLIVGLTSIIGTFIVIGGVFVPTLTLDYSDEVSNSYRKADDIQTNVVRARFVRYFFCTWSPTALALIGFILLLEVIGTGVWLQLLGGILIISSVGWIFYTPKYLENIFKNRLNYVFINIVQIILSVFAYSIIIIILISIFPEIGKWPAYIGCLVALAAFTICQIVIFVPATNSTSNKILLPPSFKSETTSTMGASFVLVGFLTMLTVTMPQLNYKIGGAALRAFHVGGNIPVAICLKTRPAAEISQRITFDSDYCSEKLSMKLDSGDRVYVSKAILKKEVNQKSSDSQPETLYFRQDEIKQKIYFKMKDENK